MSYQQVLGSLQA
jgi:hypothetical protein